MATGDPKHFPIIPPTPGPEIAPPCAFEIPTVEVCRYGLIPCRRCAFFVPGEPGASVGTCHRAPPTRKGWPHVAVKSPGCGKGLLREEAKPLPPEVK